VTTTPTTTHGARDIRLRGALLAVLFGLIATSLGVAISSSPATTRPPAQHGARPPHDKPATGPTSSTTTTIPDATTGSVTRPSAGGGCGFALTLTTTSSRRHGAAATANPVGHCTVLEIGDSLGNDLGWGMQRHVTAALGLNLVQKDVSSTGLVKTSFFNWQATLAADLRTYHPQLVLICLGGNDQQGIMVGVNAVQFPTAAWQHAYLARVRSLVTEAVDAGAYVAWVGLPIMQQPSYSQGVQILDGLYEKGTLTVPNATYLSTWSLLANPSGQFDSNASVNGTPTTLRESDGIHYSFAGEDVIATYVLRKLAAIYHVRLAPNDPAVVTSWG
jgi:hypothetical protein